MDMLKIKDSSSETALISSTERLESEIAQLKELVSQLQLAKTTYMETTETSITTTPSSEPSKTNESNTFLSIYLALTQQNYQKCLEVFLKQWRIPDVFNLIVTLFGVLIIVIYQKK
eukprot:NODE_4405_length_1173_cov_30.275238_g3893_i0.p1 GENE.NODE_4405_length_1173_cov_30.275238_g3893_i0~~NODE_4405_length_1173_cov_30.275238_g3893_i0.p1  ORF type:complete len:116 (+),score=16.21 NODE_4405_length_1173_cov_30.275238_g3893_i0:736-1083(+)